MPIDYHNLHQWHFRPAAVRYCPNDCIRYALSLGMAQDPLDMQELQYAYEEGLRVVPTFLSTVGGSGPWFRDPRSGIQWLQMLHGEQRMRFHAVVPPGADLICRTRISHVVDKGAGRGALVVVQQDWADSQSGAPLATAQQVLFCRADGGFATARQPGDAPLEALTGTPHRTPDQCIDMPTLPGAALLYRLNGDHNPIHVLPHAARQVGFERPILHGLCTYGMAARALLKWGCTNDPARLESIAARFSSPVFPGETLSVRLWFEQDLVRFGVWAKERDALVLSHGVARISHKPFQRIICASGADWP